jgi:hypothetical protein
MESLDTCQHRVNPRMGKVVMRQDVKIQEIRMPKH